MRISTNWLKDYIDLNGVDLKDLANMITKAGVNVEDVSCNSIKGLVIGEVLSVTPHPDSDHLNICEVDLGSYTTTIVCGASNVKPSIKVIVATEGTVLPGNFEIKKTTIRGIESNGMICALYEIGLEEKTEETYSKGIEILSNDAVAGTNYSDYISSDTVYTLDLNPNRSDALSHIGFAYEAASVLKKEVKLPDTSYKSIKDNIKDKFSLSIETDKCMLYNAKMVTDVVIKESPKFIKERLEASGMRSINNIVDISNYVMLEYGQPLHFFDKDSLGDKILVRTAHDNEEALTLDDKKRVLNKEDIVITDGKEIVAIAGVMGCLNSGINEDTKAILIESAIFDPLSVRHTYINQDLRSEASIRFEKGIPKEYCFNAIDRACYLLEKYADAKVLDGIITHDKLKDNKRISSVTVKEVNKVLGMTLTCEDIENSLNALNFEYKLEKDKYVVEIPERRLDIEANKADLIEEIGRLYGYDNIPNILPTGPTKSGSYTEKAYLRKKLSKTLRMLGLTETRTYTLVNEEDSNLFNYNFKEPIRLLKPMSADKAVIRMSILPSILKVVDYNNARGVKDTYLYEISNTYQNKDEEVLKLGIVIKGSNLTNRWNNIDVKADFYLLKGIIEQALNSLGLKNRYSFNKKVINDIHPGISAEIILGSTPIGFIGKVHPALRNDEVYVSEINLSLVFENKAKAIKIKELSKYPEIKKDVAFVVNKSVSGEDLMKEIKKSGGRLLVDVDVFDIYVGDKLKTDEKSIAFSLTFIDPTRTLNDEEINQLLDKIIHDMETKMNAKLRS